jgi:RimJ/RimL family protein N-acetyltransferase
MAGVRGVVDTIGRMSGHVNELGQPVGAAVPDWRPADWPPEDGMSGQYCRLERLNQEAHSSALFAANLTDATGANWTYLPYGPFQDLESYRGWVDEVATQVDPMFFTVIDTATERAVGVASYLRTDQEAGSIEVGHINYSPQLQRKRAGTEAMFLMMRRVFEELGYRRYEWKCNALNAASRAAALRLGFVYEGTFRNSGVVKGRNRDTAWFSVTDQDWPSIKRAFESWLDPANFDLTGAQRSPLMARQLPDR